MKLEPGLFEEKIIVCVCPYCKQSRKKVNGKYNIMRRGYERNGIARFFCRSCQQWFNEKTGDVMKWQGRF